MKSDYTSLLALDSFASEESMRVAAYRCALKFKRISKNQTATEVIADDFIDFAEGVRWRFEILDVMLENIDRRASPENLLTSAAKIAAWVESGKDDGLVDRAAPKSETQTRRKRSK